MNKSKKIAKLEKKVKRLEKIISQMEKPLLYFQMPISEDGNLLFDYEETKEIHNSMVEELGDRYTICTGWANVQKL